MMKKNIIITGGSRGIGRAIALYFAAKGYAVAVSGRNQNKLADLQTAIAAVSTSDRHIFSVCDMSDKAAVKQFIQTVYDKWQQIAILVNNAGVFEQGSLLTEADDLLEKLINTNLYSAYHASRAVIPAMLQHKKGSIFNICSVASQQAYPNGSSYSISKFAMLGLSKALREELKNENIKVTAVLPGATLTDSWAGVDLPESRFLKTEDIAKTIYDCYMLSENTVIEEIIIRPMLGDI